MKTIKLFKIFSKKLINFFKNFGGAWSSSGSTTALLCPFCQTHRSTLWKKDKTPSYFFFTLSQRSWKLKKLFPSFIPTVQHQKKVKSLSSSLPLILLGPATRKGKSFHARMIYFYFPSTTINLVRILATLTLESMISSRNF